MNALVMAEVVVVGLVGGGGGGSNDWCIIEHQPCRSGCRLNQRSSAWVSKSESIFGA